MTVNLLKKIHEKINDRLVGQIGTVLGENEDRTRAGIRAAVPTLLRGVMGVASTEQGAQMVERELDPFDDGIIHDYGKQLEFEKSRQLIDNGSDLVQAFFGNATVRTMGIVSRESGLGATKSRSLTGILMPLVLGVVGERRKEKNLDTASFQRLLEGQTDYIAKQVPDGVCAALNLPKLEKKPFYPPQNSKPTLAPYQPSATAGAGLTASLTESADQAAATASSSSATHSSVAAVDATNSTSASSATNTSSNSRGVGGSNATKGVLSEDGYFEGGMGWVWGLVLPLILLLGLLGWLFSRANSGDSPNEGETSQIVDREQVAELPSWDESPQPVEFDTNALLNDDIPAIAPSIDDLEDDEIPDDEIPDENGDEENGAEKNGTEGNNAEGNGAELESANKPAAVNLQPDDSEIPKEASDESSSQANNAELNKEKDTTKATLSREPLSPTSLSVSSSLTPQRPHVAPEAIAQQSIAAASPTPSNAQLAIEPTVATAINRPNSPVPSQGARFVPKTNQINNALSPNVETIDSKTGVAEPLQNDFPNALTKRFTRITQGVTEALQRIDNTEDARRASETVSRLSNDLYDLTPEFRGIDQKLRRELNQQTNAFATNIENLYDGQIDAIGEKEILLPSLIVLMQRIEATLNT